MHPPAPTPHLRCSLPPAAPCCRHTRRPSAAGKPGQSGEARPAQTCITATAADTHCMAGSTAAHQGHCSSAAITNMLRWEVSQDTPRATLPIASTHHKTATATRVFLFLFPSGSLPTPWLTETSSMPLAVSHTPAVCLDLLSQPLPQCNVVPHQLLQLLSTIHAQAEPQLQRTEAPADAHTTGGTQHGAAAARTSVMPQPPATSKQATSTKGPQDWQSPA